MLRLFMLYHLILVPYAVAVIADDAAHPERWWTVYRNPNFSIPFSIIGDALLWGWVIKDYVKEKRMARGIALLREAVRLQSEGNSAGAEILAREGKRLTGIKDESWH